MAMAQTVLHTTSRGRLLPAAPFCRGAGRAPGRGRSARPVAVLAHQQQRAVGVQVVKTSWNSRLIHASVDVHADLECVWKALTDYENLGQFIPSLVENRCLERRGNGAVLYQVGAQEVALGIKFSANCVLQCVEHLRGVPEALLSPDCSQQDSFPRPLPAEGASGTRDIAFTMLEGDFQVFKGIWRMHAVRSGAATLLQYTLYVKPREWLPVGLIQDRIEREVLRNLEAVRQYSQQLTTHSRAVGGA